MDSQLSLFGHILPTILLVLLALLIGLRLVRVGLGALSCRRGRASIKKQKLDFLLPEVLASLPEGEQHTVRFSTERHFARIFRLHPWEGLGVLHITPKEIFFFGRSQSFQNLFSGEGTSSSALRLRFSKSQTLMHYLPPKLLRDGGLSWFVLEAHQKKFYFSSGESVPELSLGKAQLSTTGIYQAVSDVYS